MLYNRQTSILNRLNLFFFANFPYISRAGGILLLKIRFLRVFKRYKKRSHLPLYNYNG